jgi:short-subunit dehydrogenase
MKLDGKIILITGASSGIGREMARQLASRAAALVLVARRLDRLEELRSELVAQNAQLKVHLFSCDLGRLEEAEALHDKVKAQAGAVDVLINNAGSGDHALFDQSDWEKVKPMMIVNMLSLVALSRAFVTDMVAKKSGGILNISSGFSLSVLPSFACYAASKKFVTAFTDGLRLDLSGTGVVVSQSVPGPVDTEFNQVSNSNDVAPALQKLVRMSAADVARASLRGLEAGRATTYPGIIFKIAGFASFFAARWFMRLILTPWAKMMRRRLPSG